MPVKVRCPECDKVLNAPDRAAGKSLKCPNCEGRVRVPGPKGSKGPRKKPRQRPADPENALAGLDLRNAEDQSTRICPKCARVVTEEDIECPACGVNIDTGVLSEKQKRKRARKGPDPEEFFDKVWKNSMTFTKKNKHLVFRTVLTWTITLTIALSCFRTAQWCWQNEFDAIVAAGQEPGVTVTTGSVVISGTKENPADYRGTKYRDEVRLPSPAILAHRIPPVIFWRVLGTAFQLGFGGWAIFLTTTVVGATMAGERTLKRVQSDFFGNVTIGFKFYFWPWYVLLPLPLLPAAWLGYQLQQSGGVLTQNEQIISGVMSGSVYFLALFLVPPAAVHMAQKHTYPAWLLLPMLRAFGRTIGPALAMAGMLVLTCALIPVGAAAGVAAGWNQLSKLFDDLIQSIGGAIGMGAGSGFFDFALVQLPMFALIVGVSLAILFLIVAWPAVYMMRAIGLYGLYFREDLDLIQETNAGDPVGFGPRFLAYCVDSIVLTLMAGVVAPLVYFVVSIGYAPFAPVAAGVASLLVAGLYFVTSECGQARATPGKWSLGILVVKDDGEPMERSDGLRRVACALLSLLTFYLGFLMCLFDPEKRALHDKLSGTRVVWKGDDERT